MQLQNIQIVYLYKLKTPEQDLAEQDVLLPLLLLHVEQSLDQPHWSKFLFYSPGYSHSENSAKGCIHIECGTKISLKRKELP